MAYPGSHTDHELSDSVFEDDGEDSDMESLSPVNGYFAQRPHPSDIFVENSSEADSKAQEAAAEQRAGSSAAPPSQLSSPALSAMSMPWSEPDVPNLNMNPPDYATATANQPTYGSIHHPAVNRALVVPQQQSMSDAVPFAVDEEAGLLTQRPDHKSKRGCRPRWCGPVSTCNGILVAAVIVLVVLLSQAAMSTDEDAPKLPENDNDPSKAPTSPTKPYFPPSEQCSFQYYSETQYFDFPSIGNFSFMEFMESNHLSGGVEGTLYVQPSTQPDQGVDIRLRIAYATTSPFRIARSNYVKDHDSFTLELPDLQKSQEASVERPCLSVFAGLEIRQGVTLENWALSTGNLDIVVAAGVFNSNPHKDEQSHLQVTGDSVFSVVRGKVDIAYWSGRRSIVETISGTIRGKFALRDLLSLKTISGNIDATVDPKPADSDNVQPAEFNAVSTSGSIAVQFPTTGDIPSRDFRTRIETVSSPIQGRYIGTSTSIHSISGTIYAHLLPCYTDAKRTTIHTATRSSKTTLRVLPPYPEDSWPSLSSEHKSTSTSGSIDVVYPSLWEGSIDGTSSSGSVSIEGKDVEIIDDTKVGPILKHVTARKGHVGSGHLGFETLSGNIKVRVGNAFYA